jgi:hypothetical protein
MSHPSLPAKLSSWLGSSPRAVPLLVAVTCGLGAPRPRRMRALAIVPAVLGLASLGVLGWRAAQARKPLAKLAVPGQKKAPFAFTWQMSEDITASAASGH